MHGLGFGCLLLTLRDQVSEVIRRRAFTGLLAMTLFRSSLFVLSSVSTGILLILQELIHGRSDDLFVWLVGAGHDRLILILIRRHVLLSLVNRRRRTSLLEVLDARLDHVEATRQGKRRIPQAVLVHVLAAVERRLNDV